MSVFVGLLAGAGFGFGVLLIILGLRGLDPAINSDGVKSSGLNGDGAVDNGARALDGWSQRSKFEQFRSMEQFNLRVILAVVLVAGVWLLSEWPVGAVLAGAAGIWVPTLAGARRRRADVIARVEAVASWAEQLRDIIGSSAGLQEAVVASARVPPLPIAEEVQNFAFQLRRMNFGLAARHFVEELADPVGDQVVAALTLASERRGNRLATVLDDVAKAAREEATMQQRVETSRSRTYSESVAVTAIVMTMFAGLLVFNRAYLEPFGSVTGQLVLAGVGVGWGLAFWSLLELSKVRRPDRLLTLGQSQVSGLPSGGGVSL